MDVVNPFDAHVGTCLVGEISESIHVVAVSLVPQIFAIDNPFGALTQTIIEQMYLCIDQNIAIGWWQEICAGGVKGLFSSALKINV